MIRMGQAGQVSVQGERLDKIVHLRVQGQRTRSKVTQRLDQFAVKNFPCYSHILCDRMCIQCENNKAKLLDPRFAA